MSLEFQILKTAVVILNYNGKHWLEKFLPSVLEHSSGAEIWVADNASTDDSIDFLHQSFPEVNLLVNARNGGYAGGYNDALKEIEAEVYVLLNSDIEVTKNWIPPILETFKNHPEIAAIQPKIRSHALKDHFEHAGASGGYIDFLGFPFCRGRLFHKVETDLGQYENPSYVFWATGACLFIRSKDFHEIGGLDELFFAHMEEIDLCWRLQRKGRKSAVVPSSMVYHVGGGTLNTLSPRKTFLNFRNNLFMLYKNLPKKGFKRLMFIRLSLDGIAGVKFLIGMQPRHFLAVLRAHGEFYKNLKALKVSRKAIPHHPSFDQMEGIYMKSVVAQFFLFGKRKFSDLPEIKTNLLEKPLNQEGKNSVRSH